LIQADTPKQKLIVSPELIELGKIQSPQVLERYFFLKNSGDAELIVNSITVDCPCSSFQMKNGDHYEEFLTGTHLPILPGSSVECKLVFDSSKTRFVGKFTKYIVINSTDPEWPVKRNKLVGELGR
jgi:hypothetical protein